MAAHKVVVQTLVLVVEPLDFAVAYLGHFAVVAVALSLFGFELQLLYHRLVALYLCDYLFFGIPFRAELVNLFLDFGYFAVQLLELCVVVLALYGFALYFQLFLPAREFVKFFGHGVAFDTQFCGGFIHKVDCLIGQKAVGDVAVGKFNGRNYCIVLNAHMMVVFVLFLYSSQNGNGVVDIGLVNHYGLETPFESLVFLEIFLVFVERGGTDASQFAARKCRFQNVGCVHCAFALSGSYKRVDFVDEKYNLAFGTNHFVHHRFQSFLKLALVFGACHERAHVERIHFLVFKVLGHIAAHDALGQAFDYCRLAGSRFAYKYRVVFRAARQYLQHAPYLVVAPDDGIEFALACRFN